MADDGFDPPIPEWSRKMGYDAERARDLADAARPWDDYFRAPDRTADDLPRRRSNPGGGLPAILDHVDVTQLLSAFAANTLAGLFAESAPGRFPTEPPEGSVLRFVKHFDRPGRFGLREYTYVALRAGGRWYLTGKTSVGITFAELVEEIGDCPCHLAMDWAEISAPETSPSESMSPSDWYLATYPVPTADDDESASRS